MAPPTTSRHSGGIFRDMTIHDLDMARWLLGEEPVRLTAIGSRLIDPRSLDKYDDYDTAMVLLQTASRQAVPHQQLPRGGLWLRPARRGVRLQRHAAAWTTCARPRSGADDGGRHRRARAAAELLPGALRRKPTGPRWRPSSTRWPRASPCRPPCRMASRRCAGRCAVESVRTGRAVAV